MFRRLGDICIEGAQNMPPQNISLWHKHYFKLKAIMKQQMHKELSAFLLSGEKQGINFSLGKCCSLPSPIPRGKQPLSVKTESQQQMGLQKQTILK